MSTEVFGRGLSNAELKTYEERWRAIVRESVKLAPTPAKARPLDLILCFDAAIDELMVGRKIMTGAALTAPPSRQRRRKGGAR